MNSDETKKLEKEKDYETTYMLSWRLSCELFCNGAKRPAGRSPPAQPTRSSVSVGTARRPRARGYELPKEVFEVLDLTQGSTEWMLPPAADLAGCVSVTPPPGMFANSPLIWIAINSRDPNICILPLMFFQIDPSFGSRITVAIRIVTHCPKSFCM
jgi:hypothetical protein